MEVRNEEVHFGIDRAGLGRGCGRIAVPVLARGDLTRLSGQPNRDECCQKRNDNGNDDAFDQEIKDCFESIAESVPAPFAQHDPPRDSGVDRWGIESFVSKIFAYQASAS